MSSPKFSIVEESALFAHPGRWAVWNKWLIVWFRLSGVIGSEADDCRLEFPGTKIAHADLAWHVSLRMALSI